MERSKKGHNGVVAKCSNFQQVKTDHQNSGVLLQQIQIPTLKLEDINIDFVIGLHRTQKSYDSIWVVVDPLTKFAHFILVKFTYSAEDYARSMLDYILCRHGILLSIILDRGAQFTSRFLRSFQKGLGTKVKLSTVFHPQTNGQAKPTIQTLEDMLRACIIDFTGNWDKHLPLVAFAYNSSYHSSIFMALYEALYGRICRSQIIWFEMGEYKVLGHGLIYKTLEKVHT